MSDRVQIREVGPRDGLQMIKEVIDTEHKLDWIVAQAKAGFDEIEVTSFVPLKIMPQFSDAKDVLKGALKIDGLCANVLVPNLRGAMDAFDQGAEKITFVLSASEAHNLSNVRRSTDASLAMFGEIIEARKQHPDVKLSFIISTCFGCSIQGDVPEKRVVELAEAAADMGADEVSLADTVGYASPRQVSRIFAEASKHVAAVPLAAHFHDTRGLGLANVMAAFDEGVRRFDAALAGLGGCPFAPGATGNIATEDAVFLFESIGVDTGVDLDAMINTREQLARFLPAEKLGGNMLRAGLPKGFSQRAKAERSTH